MAYGLYKCAYCGRLTRQPPVRARWHSNSYFPSCCSDCVVSPVIWQVRPLAEATPEEQSEMVDSRHALGQAALKHEAFLKICEIRQIHPDDATPDRERS